LRKSFKNDLQNKKSVIYYVSVARRKRRCSEADINTGKFCGSQFETFGFEKNRKKSKSDLQNKKSVIYYVSVAC